jgi:hypothetical protein
MAAVLASGPEAVLSHRSATALWGMWGSGAGEAHVIVPRHTGSSRSIKRHFGVLPLDEVTKRDGIPVTSAARAVLDLAADKGEADPGGRLRSPLEELFLPFLDAHQIPRPRLNHWITVGDDRFQVDCFWPDARLIGELDDFRSHGTRRAMTKDRRRDRRLLAATFRVVRITESQLLTEPSEVAADLRRATYNRP